MGERWLPDEFMRSGPVRPSWVPRSEPGPLAVVILVTVLFFVGMITLLVLAIVFVGVPFMYGDS